MRMIAALDDKDVEKLKDACHEEAGRRGREATIAIVDPAGHPFYIERPVGNGPNTVEMAIAKARTAALRGRPSATLVARVKEHPGWLMAPNYLCIEGGAPVLVDGECLGGVGVSGIDVDDEPVALYGAKALSA